jgi:hypothetical protein
MNELDPDEQHLAVLREALRIYAMASRERDAADLQLEHRVPGGEGTLGQDREASEMEEDALHDLALAVAGAK